MNLITANQVTDRCNRLSYLSVKPGAADVLQVVSNIGRYQGPAGRDCQPVAHGRGSGFSENPRGALFTVVTHITKEEWDRSCQSYYLALCQVISSWELARSAFGSLHFAYRLR